MERFLKAAIASALVTVIASTLVNPSWARPLRGSAAAGNGATPVFNFANFTGSSAVHPTGNVALSGNVFNMWDGTSHHGGGLWSNTVQNIQSFSTTFTFKLN